MSTACGWSPATPGSWSTRPWPPLSGFAGQRVLAAAGIGNPERFASLRAAASRPPRCRCPTTMTSRSTPLPTTTAARSADAILITEKDAVKCERFDDPRIWVVPTTPVIDAGLIDKIRGAVAARAQAAHAAAAAAAAAEASPRNTEMDNRLLEILSAPVQGASSNTTAPPRN